MPYNPAAASSTLAEYLHVPEIYEVLAAPTALTPTVHPTSGKPARQIAVGGVSGTVVLTRLDGTTVTLSEALQRMGVLNLQFVAVQSAAGTDILVGY